MASRFRLVLGFLVAFSGCVGGANPAGGAPAATPVKLLPAPAGEVPAGGNQVRFEVDGQSFAFRTPEVRHSRSRVGTKIVAHSFELANAENSLYARLVLNVDEGEGETDLSGEYVAASLGDPDLRALAGVGEVVLAEETDAVRGRRMLPSGSGTIVVGQQAGRVQVRFETRGDGLFRDADAAPVTGTFDFHWRP